MSHRRGYGYDDDYDEKGHDFDFAVAGKISTCMLCGWFIKSSYFN